MALRIGWPVRNAGFRGPIPSARLWYEVRMGIGSRSPFAGRRPIFAGDDVTDEAGFEQVRQFGGIAIKVGPEPTRAQFRCESVAQLGKWLMESAGVAWPEPGSRELSA